MWPWRPSAAMFISGTMNEYMRSRIEIGPFTCAHPAPSRLAVAVRDHQCNACSTVVDGAVWRTFRAHHVGTRVVFGIALFGDDALEHVVRS